MKDIVKALHTQGRLIKFQCCGADAPRNDQAWCAEALASHEVSALTGVIVTESVKRKYVDKPLVQRIDHLGDPAHGDDADWWNARGPSVRLDRKLEEYRKHLGPILRYAKSLDLIDPHLDPAKHRWDGVKYLLEAAGGREPQPTIRLHRVCWVKDQGGRRILDHKRIEDVFHWWLDNLLRAANLKTKVMIWDDFRDRCLLSNLMGISLPHGFDTSRRARDLTTWSRLAQPDVEDLRREFGTASGAHCLRHSFSVP